MTEPSPDQGKVARGPRSPNFPAITLQDALTKARVLYDRDKRNPVRVKTILEHLGFSDTLSGSSARVISALRQFGLIDESDDMYRITDAAFRIFTLSDSAPERLKALQDCARKPAIYRELLERYADGLPSEPALKDALILRKFNPASVDTFIRVFKASIDFAKLTPGAYSGPEEGEAPNSELRVALGDYVQWESQGVSRFEVPRKVTGLSEDGLFVFVEGSATGIPMDQVSKTEPPQTPQAPPLNPAWQPPTPSKVTVTPGVSREVFALGEGIGVVALEWPDNMDAAALEDVSAWLEIVMRKLRRLKGAAARQD